MTRYAAYGLLIESEVPLPELRTVVTSAGDPDVRIRIEDVTPVPDSVEGAGIERFEADRDECRLTYDSVGTFLIQDGERILCNPASPDATPSKFFSRVIANQGLGILLHQRGSLVLHGSAVSVDGRAVVFLGERGAGKSTTAAAFHARGHPVIADDVVAIDLDGDTPSVLPGVAHLRLLPDAAEALGVDAAQAEGDLGREKWYQEATGVEAPLPLAGFYLLGQTGTLGLERVTGQAAFLELLRHTYTVALHDETDSTTDNFELIARVLDDAGAKGVRRLDDLDTLTDLVDLIASDVSGAEAEDDPAPSR